MIRLEEKGARKLSNLLGQAAAKRIVRYQRDAMEWGARKIKTDVENGNWFDHPTGQLRSQLWLSGIQRTGDQLSIDLGWGGPSGRYGPVLEYGPTPKNRRGWWIRAKFAKRLRKRSGGSVTRPKKYWHPWTEDQQRPHYSKALQARWPEIRKELDNAVITALRREGGTGG